MPDGDDFTVVEVPPRQTLNNSCEEPSYSRLSYSMGYFNDIPHQSDFQPKGRVSILNGPPKVHMEENETSKKNNGWTNENEEMLRQWSETLKATSFAYQYLLDKSFNISTRLSLISICSSSILSIFAGFKLWVQDNKAFQSAGDIVMLFSNFLVAAITTASKRYLDDQRNQKIRTYLNQLDQFYAIIFTQLSMLPQYRIPADEFFNKYKETYTRTMVSMPSVSIKEITIAKNKYLEFEKAINNIEYIDAGTNTENHNNTRRTFI